MQEAALGQTRTAQRVRLLLSPFITTLKNTRQGTETKLFFYLTNC